jgi:lipopolysaccharide heptosyltransferase II
MQLSPIRNYSNFFRYLATDITRCLWIRKLGIGFGRTPNRILVANFHGIGNMILFTPVLQTLRASYPRAEITMVVANRGTREVISESGLVDKIFEYDAGNDEKRDNFHQLVEYLRQLDFDLGFSCTKNSIESLLLFEANTRYRIGFSYKIRSLTDAKFLLHATADHDHSKHEVIQNLDLLKPLGIKAPQIRPSFYFKPHHLDSALQKLKSSGIALGDRRIGFHAGSHVNLSQKKWPFDYFAKVAAETITQYNAQAVFVGGRNERGEVERIIKLMVRPAANLAGLLTLKETAAVISTMKLFISNDSGPMHIAAGVGTPVIGIFGPTDEAKNAPWPQPGIPAKAIRNLTGCAPCYFPYSGKIDCDAAECLRKLTPDMVLQACRDMLKEIDQT